jgi:sialate O-acetylesterase
MSIEAEKIRIEFDHIGGGLASRDGNPLNWFEIMDAEQRQFVKADAQIDGSAVLLSSKIVKHPVAMRFAWSKLAEPNLMNREGLPAGAFRAGAVPANEMNTSKLKE